MRIGISTGFAIMGNFGSRDRMDYTIYPFQPSTTEILNSTLRLYYRSLVDAFPKATGGPEADPDICVRSKASVLSLAKQIRLPGPLAVRGAVRFACIRRADPRYRCSQVACNQTADATPDRDGPHTPSGFRSRVDTFSPSEGVDCWRRVCRGFVVKVLMGASPKLGFAILRLPASFPYFIRVAHDVIFARFCHGLIPKG